MRTAAEVQAEIDYVAEKIQWLKRANAPKGTIKKEEKIFERLKIESGEYPSVKVPEFYSTTA